jgi:hypothetical protein
MQLVAAGAQMPQPMVPTQAPPQSKGVVPFPV